MAQSMGQSKDEVVSMANAMVNKLPEKSRNELESIVNEFEKRFAVAQPDAILNEFEKRVEEYCQAKRIDVTAAMVAGFTGKEESAKEQCVMEECTKKDDCAKKEEYEEYVSDIDDNDDSVVQEDEEEEFKPQPDDPYQ
jgi:predicted nucleic acid-binding protein